MEEQVRVFDVRRTPPAIAGFGDGRRVADQEMGAASGDWKSQGDHVLLWTKDRTKQITSERKIPAHG